MPSIRKHPTGGNVVLLRTLTFLCVFIFAAAGTQPARAAGAGRHDGARHKVSAARRGRATRPGGQVSDINGLVKALRGRGLKVERAGRVSQPFFSVGGSALTVNGDNVQVVRYASARAAAREAGRISPDGSGGATSTAMWVGPPHFHRKGRLIVLHVGSDAAVRDALTALLGPQFAGR